MSVIQLNYSGIHTPCPGAYFWPNRHNFGDIELKFCILSIYRVCNPKIDICMF